MTEENAKAFAIKWHGDQVRKYTGEPYWHHLRNVADIVRTVPHNDSMIMAAWLHDVLEDTMAPVEVVVMEFGVSVAMMVQMLTDSAKSVGNRAYRKQMDCVRLGTAHPDIKTVKLADLIDNTSSIVQYDPNFAKVYLGEKRALLPYLKGGDDTLWHRAAVLAGLQETPA